MLLTAQDRSRWDREAIDRGLAALARADALAAAPGPYHLQAAIAACHARAVSIDTTEWARIAALYGQLAVRAPSPVVELNRAIAISMVNGQNPGNGDDRSGWCVLQSGGDWQVILGYDHSDGATFYGTTLTATGTVAALASMMRPSR